MRLGQKPCVGPRDTTERKNSGTMQDIVHSIGFFFSLVQLESEIGFLYHPPPSPPGLDVPLLHSTLVHIMA